MITDPVGSSHPFIALHRSTNHSSRPPLKDFTRFSVLLCHLLYRKRLDSDLKQHLQAFSLFRLQYMPLVFIMFKDSFHSYVPYLRRNLSSVNVIN